MTNRAHTHSDGKADYIWTDPRTGASTVWLNNHPQSPRYLQQETTGGVGVSGNNVRYAYLQKTGRASYVFLDQNTGAFAARLYNCPVTTYFDIYSGDDFAWDTNFPSWQIFPGEPDCNDAASSPLYFDRDDVSRDEGVRCKDNCDGDISKVEELEMHFNDENPVLHWSKSR
jgi:hypothetical protein